MAEIKSNNTFEAFGDYSELAKIREYVKGKASEFGLDSQKVYYIVLAVDEACSNLIRYNMQFDRNKSLSLKITTSNKGFKVTIKDSGKSFNPADSKSPDMEDYFTQYKKGGLGIHLIKSIVDEIDYTPSKNGKDNNTLMLTMKK